MKPATRDRLAIVLVAAAVLWILVNGPVEGATLVVLSYNHGITVADLLSVAAVFAAAGLVWSSRRQRPAVAPSRASRDR